MTHETTIRFVGSDARRVLTGSSRLSEFVQERVPRGDRALCDRCRSICPVRSMLQETVPMLQGDDVTLDDKQPAEYNSRWT